MEEERIGNRKGTFGDEGQESQKNEGWQLVAPTHHLFSLANDLHVVICQIPSQIQDVLIQKEGLHLMLSLPCFNHPTLDLFQG